MTRAQKAQKILEQLEGFYPETPVPLDHRDPYTLLLAVLLSAQTTDKKVNEVTPALFDAAPDPVAMVGLGVDKIREYIRQIGLAPTKAKNIHKLSQILLERHQGQIPRTLEELEELPGVGHKTASVVVAQAFGQPAFPVDTHIHRLAHRWRLSDGSNVKRTEEDLKKAFPRSSWNKVHLQIIFFGREYCPALYHDLSQCPICSWAASKKHIKEEATANLNRRRRKK